MAVGTFSLVLHSHLPYYRKAGMWPFGEENLYEAIAETYIPLLDALFELKDEGIAAKVTIGITPVLAEQLADPYLKQGFETYIADILERVENDQHRYSEAGEREKAQWEAGERREAKLVAAKAAWLERQAPAEKPLEADTVVPVAGTVAPIVAASVSTSLDLSPPLLDPEPTLADFPEEPLEIGMTHDPRRELADYYHAWFAQRLASFRERYHRDLLGAFKQLQDEGCIEIITSAATHGFSPLLSRDSSLHAQFKIGVDTYKKYFGRAPKGVWLPECAYRAGIDDGEELRPPIDQFLREVGLEYFFTDSHAVVGGTTSGYRRHIGLYGNIEYVPMPERPVSGLTTFQGYWLPENPVAVYARNEIAGYQVWSADQGYPGDGWYREFHKKDGNSGMPYWRITGPKWDLAHKDFYNPQMAMQRVAENSDHYVSLIQNMLKEYQDATGEEGHVVVPFDTELFGHWWFEGVEWIKQVIRKMAQGSGIKRATVGEHHAQHPPSLAYQLPESTWGAGGHFHVWMNPQVEFMWPTIHRCERRMEELVKRVPTPANELQKRALDQAARELLLLEGSDWPFLVTTGQAKVYAIDRFNEHVERFDTLADAILAGDLTEEVVATIADIDNAFADIDYRDFASRQYVIEATHK